MRPRIALLVCGALVMDVREVIARRGWDVDVHGLPATYHLHPRRLVAAVDEKLGELTGYDRVVVVYGDCGTAGAIDEVLRRHGAVRPPGPHCYEMLMGAVPFGRMAAERPGTFFLTSWLVRNWERAVVKGLGLDRFPNLKETYFRHFTHVVYLRRQPIPELDAKARAIADYLGLALEVRETRFGDLEERLAELIEARD